MKELTYEDWQKNPIPRKMWVWNDNKEEKVQRKVLYIFFHDKGQEWNVSTLSDDETATYVYKHCAEIKEERRMTNKELSRWLREKPTREYKYVNDSYVFSYYEYKEGCEEEEVPEKSRIRENYGKWKEPLIEQE